MSPANTRVTRTLVVSRVFNAPLDLVWRTWTDPELLMQWWGPDLFTCPFAKMDVREGGRTRRGYVDRVHARAERIRWARHVQRMELSENPMASLDFIQHMADKDGNRVDPKALGLPPDFPSDTRTLVTFEALSSDKTKMVVSQFEMPTADSELGKHAEIGLDQCVDKMRAIFADM
jgi:uncharacterized protein YndB with AHSA1/START domain